VLAGPTNGRPRRPGPVAVHAITVRRDDLERSTDQIYGEPPGLAVAALPDR
jgi:hypothetical protein